MESIHAVVGLAIVGVAGYLLYSNCSLKSLGLAPTECGTTTRPTPITTPNPKPGPSNCVPLYGSIGPNQQCCKEDGTCCAKGTEAIVKDSMCYPRVPSGTSIDVQNKYGHTTDVLDVELALRDGESSVYVDSAFPLYYWSVSNLPENQWCRANALAWIVEADGSKTPWFSLAYEISTLKDSNGLLDPGGTSTSSIIQRPIRGFIFQLVLHVASGFAGCGLGENSWNILDKVRVRFQ